MPLKNLQRERKYLLREEVNIINTEEKRNYFREFQCEVLTSNPNNKELIKEFIFVFFCQMWIVDWRKP